MKEETCRFVAGISLIAALASGLLVWSHSKPASTPPLQANEPVQEAGEAPRARPLPSAAPPAKAQPQAPIAQAGAQPEPEATAKPERIPFPADLPAPFTPEHFHDALVQAVAECQLPYQVEEEDCTEFPCIVWGKWGSGDPKFAGITACRGWKERFGDSLVSYPGSEGSETRLGLVALPPGPRLSDETFTHIAERAHGMIDSHQQPRIRIGAVHDSPLRKAGPAKPTGDQLARK